MASISQLSEEERNFIRFHLLNLKASPEIARRFFDGVFPPAYLAQTINRNFAAIINLNKLKRINAVQLDLLRRVPGTVWPSNLPPIPIGTNATSSKDFDLTMMICLLRNLGGLITPSTGWDQLPHPNDTLPGADLATLKWYRNQMAHASVTYMDNNAFTDGWTRVEKALTSLNKGQIPHAVTEILNYDLDGEKAKRLVIAELEQMTKEYMESEKEKEQIESEYSYYKDGNLPKNIADANENLVKTWFNEDEIFYETKGFELVYNKVKNSNCILVTSNSGIGKTATIRHIALKLKLQGFEIVPVEFPDDIVKYKTSKKQVFLIDDVLGKYDLSPTLLEKWERLDEKLISCLETELGPNKILCTQRLQITLNKRFENASTILNKVVINLDHESCALSKQEKQKILMKHLRRSNLENEISTEEIEMMCENNYAFPLLCKLVSNSKERFSKKIAFFKQPLSLLREELDKINHENKKLYCILVICMLYNGSFRNSIFDIYSDEYETKLYSIIKTCGLQRNMSKKELEDSALSAIGSYFKKDHYNFRFIHDALEETVGWHFFENYTKEMLSECDICFIRDRIRVNSNENICKNDNENIVFINLKEDKSIKDDHQPLFNRLCDELTNGRFSTLLTSKLFRNENFVLLFGNNFDKNHRKLKIKHTLLTKTSTGGIQSSNQSVYDFFLNIISKDEFKDNKDAISRVIEANSSRRTLMYWIVAFGCYEFFQYAWSKMTTLERKWIMGRDYISNPLVKSLFPLAVLGGNFQIVKELIRSGADVNCFSQFGETPLYIAVKSGCCKMVRLLVENGAQVNRRGWFTMNIPILATTNKPELISIILEYDLNQTEIHKAVRLDDLESLRSKLRSEDIYWKTKSGWTVLHYAVLLNNLQAVDFLFHEELALNNDSYFDSRKLLQVSIADNNGLTAVHLAVINNNVDILSVLLRNNAAIKVRDEFDRTPLHYTTSGIATNMLVSHIIRKQCLENTRLIEEGRKYDKTPMSALRTMFLNITLHTAFRNICRDFINMPDKKGNTALHYNMERSLLKEERGDCIETLLDNGANPHLVNDSDISAYALNKSSFDTVESINNSSKYRQSIYEYHKVFALVMFVITGLTLGILIYMSLSSLNRNEFQKDYVCVGQDSESANIKLLQLTRGIYVILPTLPFLLSLSIMKLSVFHWRMFEFIAFGSFIIVCIFLFTPFVYDLMYESIFIALLSKWSMRYVLTPERFRNFSWVIFIACSLLIGIISIPQSFIGFGEESFQSYLPFYTKNDIGILNIAALNCTDFTSSSTNISCTSLANNITYKSNVDFSVQCRTDPNITNYNGTLAVESGFLSRLEIGLISFFCMSFYLNAVCSFCFLHCICFILISKHFKNPRLLFHETIFFYWSIIIVTFMDIILIK